MIGNKGQIVKDYISVASRFVNRLRPIVPFYGFSTNAIELIFMKYMSEFENVYSPEQFKTLMSYKSMFISKCFDLTVVKNTFGIAEDVYSIEKGLLESTVKDLNNIFNEKQDYLFEVLNEFDLPKEKDIMVFLLEFILEYGENKDVSRNSVSSTSSSLVELADKILDVKQDEVYLDCFAGFNKTALKIEAASYLGYEINSEVAAISNMLMILSGKKIFDIKNQNFYLSQCHSVADKVFADGPVGLILSLDEYQSLGEESKKGDYYNLKNAVEALKQNGRAVVTCPGGSLFRADLRKIRELLTFRNLKAVISLPPLWNYTSMPTNIVVFEKERESNEIIMIDASSNDNIFKPDKRTSILKKEVINKIVDSLKGKYIDGFSQVVSPEMILKENENQSWVPSHYIKKKIDVEFRPSVEVKKELDDAYKELFSLLSK